MALVSVRFSGLVGVMGRGEMGRWLGADVRYLLGLDLLRLILLHCGGEEQRGRQMRRGHTNNGWIPGS